MGANCCKHEVQKEQSPSYPNKNKEKESLQRSINPSSPTKSFTDKLNNKLNECLNEPSVEDLAESTVEDLEKPLITEQKEEPVTVRVVQEEVHLLPPVLDPKKSTLTQNQDYEGSVYFSCASNKPSRAESFFVPEDSTKISGRKSHFVNYVNEPQAVEKENFQQFEHNQEVPQNQVVVSAEEETESQRETLEAIGESKGQPVFSDEQEKQQQKDDEDDDEEFFETQSAFAENENVVVPEPEKNEVPEFKEEQAVVAEVEAEEPSQNVEEVVVNDVEVKEEVINEEKVEEVVKEEKPVESVVNEEKIEEVVVNEEKNLEEEVISEEKQEQEKQEEDVVRNEELKQEEKEIEVEEKKEEDEVHGTEEQIPETFEEKVQEVALNEVPEDQKTSEVEEESPKEIAPLNESPEGEAITA